MSEDDSDELVEQQWRRLNTAFAEPNSVLILHYFNHYAMVYAMREWRDAESGAVHREILTSKPAQRPCRWVPWAELRRWLVSWQGYTIFKLELARGEAREGAGVGNHRHASPLGFRQASPPPRRAPKEARSLAPSTLALAAKAPLLPPAAAPARAAVADAKRGRASKERGERPVGLR